MKRFILASIIIIFSYTAAAADNTSLGFQRPKDIKLAPDFSINDLNGNNRHLKDFKGKVILVHFWATWCLPCRKELPAVNALWERFKDKGLVVAAIAEDSRKRVGAFLKEYGFNFPILIDQYGSAMRSYGVRFLPESYLVGKKGDIEFIVVGPQDWMNPEIVDLIEGLLNKN